jgi:hypothetical protein
MARGPPRTGCRWAPAREVLDVAWSVALGDGVAESLGWVPLGEFEGHGQRSTEDDAGEVGVATDVAPVVVLVDGSHAGGEAWPVERVRHEGERLFGRQRKHRTVGDRH